MGWPPIEFLESTFPAPGALPTRAGKATGATIHGKMEIINLMAKDVAGKGHEQTFAQALMAPFMPFPNMMPQYPQAHDATSHYHHL